MKKIIAFSVIALLIHSSVYAQSTSATGSITADIESRALTLESTTALRFGSILPFSTSGTVRITTAGVVVPDNVHMSDASTAGSSRWNVTGIENAPFVITLPTEATLSNGTDSMTVTNFQHSGGSTPSLGATGSRNFTVGATLSVGGGQPPGAYTGTFDVTVNYP